ncbi:MAG: hypothetical protein P1P89_01435 [Desulfobacterales bacterium]|nr:hypothetical protein [Desulfobacterales bacterium]
MIRILSFMTPSSLFSAAAETPAGGSQRQNQMPGQDRLGGSSNETYGGFRSRLNMFGFGDDPNLAIKIKYLPIQCQAISVVCLSLATGRPDLHAQTPVFQCVLIGFNRPLRNKNQVDKRSNFAHMWALTRAAQRRMAASGAVYQPPVKCP